MLSELAIFILFFILSTGVTFYLIILLSKAGVGSVIRTQGPASHIEKKDTPSLAGLGFIILLLTFLVIIAAMKKFSGPIAAIILVAIGYGLLGLTDDLMKQFLKKSSGFRARYRLPLQLLIALAFALWLRGNVEGHGIAIPGFLTVWVPGWWLVFIDVILVAGFVNAFNFTDGLDGLAGGLGIICAAVLGYIAWKSNLYTYLGTFPWNVALLPIAAFAGIAGGFLVFNWHPARIFMGDGGAYALGGFIAAYAVTTGLHIGLIIAGLVFAVEILSVIIQVISFRTTGRRVFAMTPIHHAFEQKGYREVSIVHCFWLAGVVCAIACFTLFNPGWVGNLVSIWT
jgi:phospho-N-acetylmuramoyl-pentapeptide-transferase